MHKILFQKSPLLSKRNEVRVDVLALATSRLNITYERFLNKNFSVGVSGNLLE